MRYPVLLGVLALGAGLGAVPAAAQVPFDTNRNQGIGVTLGAASGSGLSYTEILPSAYGFRGVLALWKYGDFSFVDVGASGLRILSDDGRRRLYLVASTSYWRREDEKTEDEFDEEGTLTGTRTFQDVDDSWAAGLGAGVELPLGARAGLSLEGVFTYWADTGDLLPLPQISLHYLF
ncbi:MAG: hypothetical protein ABR559_06690 [Gemmatimonadota bacterium]